MENKEKKSMLLEYIICDSFLSWHFLDLLNKRTEDSLFTIIIEILLSFIMLSAIYRPKIYQNKLRLLGVILAGFNLISIIHIFIQAII